MPISDARAFADILSEITMGASRIDAVSRPDVPGFVVELIERGLSYDSRRADSFREISEILKQNRSEIAACVDSDEMLMVVG
jgi:hypothetical protein